jgi:hypothetical protein
MFSTIAVFRVQRGLRIEVIGLSSSQKATWLCRMRLVSLKIFSASNG